MTRNKDGFGMMRWGRRGPVVDTGLGTYEDFKKVYDRKYVGYEHAVHFRYATHGESIIENCHPYEVSENLFMMHNGVIHDYPEIDKKMSDTWNFARLIEDHARAGNLRDPNFMSLVEMAIGGGSKFLFLDKEGFFWANKYQGKFDKPSGIWYSNTTMWNSPAHFKDPLKYYTGDPHIVTATVTPVTAATGTPILTPPQAAHTGFVKNVTTATKPGAELVAYGSSDISQYLPIQDQEGYKTFWHNAEIKNPTPKDLISSEEFDLLNRQFVLDEDEISDQEACNMIEAGITESKWDAFTNQVRKVEGGFQYKNCDTPPIQEWFALAPDELEDVCKADPVAAAELIGLLFSDLFSGGLPR